MSNKTNVVEINDVKKFKKYEYPERLYFVDYQISHRFGDTLPRWVRNPMMSCEEVQMLLNSVLTPSFKDGKVVMDGMDNFRVQLEEQLDEEATGDDGEGLGYTNREKCFGSNYQDVHQRFLDRGKMDDYRKSCSLKNWGKEYTMVPQRNVISCFEDITEKLGVDDLDVNDYLI